MSGNLDIQYWPPEILDHYRDYVNHLSSSLDKLTLACKVYGDKSIIEDIRGELREHVREKFDAALAREDLDWLKGVLSEFFMWDLPREPHRYLSKPKAFPTLMKWVMWLESKDTCSIRDKMELSFKQAYSEIEEVARLFGRPLVEKTQDEVIDTFLGYYRQGVVKELVQPLHSDFSTLPDPYRQILLNRDIDRDPMTTLFDREVDPQATQEGVYTVRDPERNEVEGETVSDGEVMFDLIKYLYLSGMNSQVHEDFDRIWRENNPVVLYRTEYLTKFAQLLLCKPLEAVEYWEDCHYDIAQQVKYVGDFLDSQYSVPSDEDTSYVADFLRELPAWAEQAREKFGIQPSSADIEWKLLEEIAKIDGAVGHRTTGDGNEQYPLKGKPSTPTPIAVGDHVRSLVSGGMMRVRYIEGPIALCGFFEGQVFHTEMHPLSVLTKVELDSKPVWPEVSYGDKVVTVAFTRGDLVWASWGGSNGPVYGLFTKDELGLKEDVKAEIENLSALWDSVPDVSPFFHKSYR